MEQKQIHPKILAAKAELQKGNISRRSFLRMATLLGLSVGSANLLAFGTAGKARAAATPIVRGGILKAATRIERVDHPARFSLVSQSHAWRHVFDYLTRIDANGVVHPYLLESWSASDDLKTWTLNLRKGIKFSNGKDFTADDVLFNFSQWLNVDIGSPLMGSLSFMDPAGQEKIDDHTVVCHLKAPTVVLAENLFHFAAAIVPDGFGGDITKEPIGTGAFLMKEYVPGERCRLEARKDYWQKGTDGKPLPYLDEIVMVQLGNDPSADVAALRAGQVDTILEPPVSTWEALHKDKRFNVTTIPTAASRVLRVRVDQDPWKDARVRQALKHCHHREKILAIALRNQGVIGNDSHIAPAMAEYVDDVKPYPFDTEKAKQLLAEAGYPNGIDVTLTVSNEWPESMAYAQVLKEDAKAAGIRITLNPMPASQYWDGWIDFNMGITWWSHRPTALMLLPLCYIADEKGKPVPWNESHWIDKEFQDLLTEAQKTPDLAERKKIMRKMSIIMKERAGICTPFFMSVWSITTKAIHGVEPSPEEFAIFHAAWKEA